MQTEKRNILTPQEKEIIIDGHTEKPFSGEYNDFNQKGIYVCKLCDVQLCGTIASPASEKIFRTDGRTGNFQIDGKILDEQISDEEILDDKFSVE